MKKVLIIGINGQDGYFLSNFLLKKNYKVFGLARVTKHNTYSKKVKIFTINYKSFNSILKFFSKYKFDEIYNLAAQSYVTKSWNQIFYTFDLNYKFYFYLLEAIKLSNPKTKILQAISSEVFGNSSKKKSQNENTPHNPLSPYGLFKSQSFQLSDFYRKFYNMYISNVILFNHESFRRKIDYVFQKLTYAAACLSLNIKSSPKKNELNESILKNSKIKLGNLKIKRDWGSAEDYVEAMWLILQQKRSQNFVVGTGISRSLKEICKICFSIKGLDWRKHVVSNKDLFRKHEIIKNKANITKIKKIGWCPKTSIRNLLSSMIDANIQQINKEFKLKKNYH
jgi:GDPmannose 4,6-dehydratase